MQSTSGIRENDQRNGARRTRLPAEVAHDLGNWVQCALSAVRIARRSALRQSGTDLLNVLGDAANALERVGAIARALNYGCSADGHETLSVVALVVSLRKILSYVAGTGIHLDTLVSDGLPPVICNRSELENALINLVANARDAMPAGGALLVEVRRCTDRHPSGSDCCVSLRVQDDGCGMSPTVAARAASRFFSTKGEAGRGHGLANASRFVEEIGGLMEIRSNEGRGTSVLLHIPAAPMGLAL